MPPKGIKRLKTVNVKGRTYYYFRSSRVDAKGKPVLVRLPDMDDPSFWAAYAGCHEASKAADDDKVTVPKLVDQYLESARFKSKAAGTREYYTRYLLLLSDQYQTADAQLIERRDILKVANTLKPGAANLFLSSTSALYAWGRYEEIVTNDPCKSIERNDVGEHEPWPQALIDAALVHDDPVIRLGVHLLYFTAQRIGDVCRMRWTDIDDGEVHVVQEKTNTELFIRLHSSLVEELSGHAKSFDTILTLEGKAITKRLLRYRIQAFAKALGHNVVPHGLRKNAVNALLEAGCTVAQTAAISGQSLQIVERYARRRDRKHLGSAAILQWERSQKENGKTGRKLG